MNEHVIAYLINKIRKGPIKHHPKHQRVIDFECFSQDWEMADQLCRQAYEAMDKQRKIKNEIVDRCWKHMPW